MKCYFNPFLSHENIHSSYDRKSLEYFDNLLNIKCGWNNPDIVSHCYTIIMCHLYGDFLFELHIEKTGKSSHLSFGNKPDILQLRDLYSLLVVFNSCAKCQKYSQLGGCFIFAKSYFDFYETLCIFSSLEAFVQTNRKMRLKVHTSKWELLKWCI